VSALTGATIPSFLNQKSKASDAAAKELAHSAQVAAETIATDNSGDYSGVTPATLNQYEATIQTASGGGNAFVFSAVGSSAGYTIVVQSTDQNKFTISRNAGLISRTCSGAGGVTTGVQGGCVNGTW
jgi:type II secretory pathway pseudopilin PulG